MRYLIAILALAAGATGLASTAPMAEMVDTDPGSDVAVPEGYRLDRYRAPVPSHVPGATTLTLERAEEIQRDGTALFIDVMRVPRSTAAGMAGKWLVATPHVAIAGSVWLPEVGEGQPTPRIERYFRLNLERLTKGDRDTGIVFYCVTDCWMSWNAAKRAVSWGYTRVYWYRDGIDVWRDFGLPTEIVEPVPLEADQDLGLTAD